MAAKEKQSKILEKQEISKKFDKNNLEIEKLWLEGTVEQKSGAKIDSRITKEVTRKHVKRQLLTKI